MIAVDQIYNMDIFELTAQCDDQSIDAIISDLPYGTTSCAWDNVIPFEPMWKEFKRIIKPNGAIVLTASQPFTSALVMSNPAWFRYEWIWEKTLATQFLDANRRPLKAHESILVFASGQTPYYPQMSLGEPYEKRQTNPTAVYNRHERADTINTGYRYPRSVIKFDSVVRGVHNTQKPLDLFEYLVRTYTRPGELVADFTCGSGTTALAARNTGRHFIAGDTDAGYCQIARDRLAAPYTPPLFPDEPQHTPPVQTSFLE